MIKRQMFSGGAMPTADPGEAVFFSSGNAASLTQSWVVPPGVYEICGLAISSTRALSTRLMRGSTTLIDTAIASGSGYGDGGNGGSADPSGNPQGAGGGAAGYTGNGGDGANSLGGGSGIEASGQPGTGGGGGGGGYVHTGSGASRGGGTGVYGTGGNGTRGVGSGNSSTPGGHGSDSGAIRAGAGITRYADGTNAESLPGGNLRYRNAVAVTPGETLTIIGDKVYRDVAQGIGWCVRILWYGGRSFPNNAPATVPMGQSTITAQNTTFTVPQGVSSLCMAAQQRNGAQAAVSVVVSGTTILRAQNEAVIGDGGGSGGLASDGGGGAGGYSGNGGNGAGHSPINANGEYYGDAGGSGSGGGGNGGDGASRIKDSGPVWGGGGNSYTVYPGTAGASVGIAGRNPAGTYTDAVDGDIGGGAPGERGGALAWKNAVAVSPGQVITVNAAGGRVRIIWGPGRSYPNNAQKV